MSNKGTFSSTTIALLIVGLVIGAGGGYFASSSSLQPKIDDLESQVSSLNSEVSTLSAEVNTLGEENSDLETQVSELNTQISELNSEKSSLETQLEIAQATISEKESDISELQETLDDYEDRIEEFTDYLDFYNATPGYNRFSIFGISFEFPKEYAIETSGMFEGPLSADNGLITGYPANESDAFFIGWQVTLFTPDLDDGLDSGIAGLPQYELKLGTRVTSELNGHVMKYQNFTLTQRGAKVYGVMAVTYCTENNVFLFIQVMREENPRIFSHFWNFAESVKCHLPSFF